MARNKNSTALFDVIHAAKKPPKSSPSASIPAPRWWGKDKKPVQKATADASENVGRQRSWLLAAKQSVGMSQAPAPVPDDAPAVAEPTPRMDAVESVQSTESGGAPEHMNGAPAPIATEPVAPKVRFMDRFKSRPVVEPQDDSAVSSSHDDDSDDAPLPVFYSTAGDPKPDPGSVPQRPPREKMIALDPLRGDIVFSLSYGGAIAAGFILLMALAIAFIAGSHSQVASTDGSDIPAPLPTPNHHTTTLVTPPVTSGLMAAITPTKPADTYPVLKPDVLEITPHEARHPADPPATPSTPLPIKATRDIGVMYMIIQSYPEQELAQKACDFVNHAGIPCTVVQGLSGWAPRDLYTVVGLKPYKKHDPALEEDEHALTILGTKFSNKFYNQFQPQGYTWRKESDGNGE